MKIPADRFIVLCLSVAAVSITKYVVNGIIKWRCVSNGGNYYSFEDLDAITYFKAIKEDNEDVEGS